MFLKIKYDLMCYQASFLFLKFKSINKSFNFVFNFYKQKIESISKYSFSIAMVELIFPAPIDEFLSCNAHKIKYLTITIDAL